MSAAKISPAGSSEVKATLSPEAQKDLEDALDETLSPQRAWVEENRRDLFKAFAKGRKVDPSPQKNIDTFNAVEGTEKDLRHALNNIYERYGSLAMYDKGLDGLARHWVVGYQSIRGKGTVQKVILYVEKTKWSGSCRALDRLADMIEGDWAVVEKPVGAIGFGHSRP